LRSPTLRPARAVERLEPRALLAAVDSLRFSELMYHPADPAGGAFVADDYEFIELVNTGAAAIDLSGVSFSAGVTFSFATSPVQGLEAGARVLVVKNAAAFEARYGAGLPVAGVFGNQLSNGGEAIAISEGATVIQSITYDDGWRAVTDGNGFSLTVVDPAAPAAMWNNAANYRGSVRAGGSPGGVEAPLQAGDIVINEILAHTDENLGDWIELHNTTGEALNIADWYLSDKGTELNRYRIAGDMFIPANGYVTFTQFDTFDNNDDEGALVPFGLSEHGESVFLSSFDSNGLAAAYEESQGFRASEREQTFGRYQLSTVEIVFVEQASQSRNAANGAPYVGPVVISEIMYNESGAGNTHEFIELHNRSDAPVLLYDPLVPANTWKFTDGVEFVFPQGLTIPAGGYLVIAAIAPEQFKAANDVPQDVTVLGPWIGSLDKSGEAVSISRPGAPELDGFVPYYRVDHVKYDDVAPWPSAPDGNGPSLLRSDADLFGNDPANWKAGTVVGGTPGRGEQVVAPLPGDTNDDGVVDLADLNNVRNNFGATGPDVLGDTDGNGVVDLTDLNAVRNNFGATRPAPAATFSRQTARVRPAAADQALGELLHEWTKQPGDFARIMRKGVWTAPPK
jgi:hypothetical protein